MRRLGGAVCVGWGGLALVLGGCSADGSATSGVAPATVVPVNLPRSRIDGYVALPGPTGIVVEAHRVGLAGQRAARLGETTVNSDGSFSFSNLDARQGTVLLTTRGGTMRHPLSSLDASAPELRALVSGSALLEGRCLAIVSPLSELRLANANGVYTHENVAWASGTVGPVAGILESECVVPVDPFSPGSKSATRARVELGALNLALVDGRMSPLWSFASKLAEGSHSDDATILQAFGEILDDPGNLSGVGSATSIVASATGGLKEYEFLKIPVEVGLHVVRCGEPVCDPATTPYCPAGAETFQCASPNTLATIRSDVPKLPTKTCGKSCQTDGELSECFANFCTQYIDHAMRPAESKYEDLCEWFIQRGANDIPACVGSEALSAPGTAEPPPAPTDEPYFSLVVPSDSNLEGTILVHDAQKLIGRSTDMRASPAISYEGGEVCPVADVCAEVLAGRVGNKMLFPTSGPQVFHFRTTYGYEFGWTFDVPSERGTRTFCNILDGHCATLGPPAQLGNQDCSSACNHVAVVCGLNNAPRGGCVDRCMSRREKAIGYGCSALVDQFISCCAIQGDVDALRSGCAEETDPEDALEEGFKECDDGGACRAFGTDLAECMGEK